MEMLEEEQLRLLRTSFGLEQRARFVHLDRIHEEVEEDVLIPSAFAPVVVAAGRRARETGETGSSRYSPREIAAAVAEGTARKSGFNTRVATAAGEAGRKGFIEPAAGTRRSGVCTEAAAEELEPGVETAVLPTVLIVGDQNAGKTSFLYCFSRNLFLQQLQLSSFLPILRASFLNARLLFFSKQQVHRLRQAAARGTAQPPQAAAATAPAATASSATASSATAQSATAQSATAQSATAQSATAQAAIAPDAGAPAAAITAPATAAASRLIASTAPARPRTASPNLAARERFASRAAGSNRPPAKAEAAAANTSTLPMSPSDTCLERDNAESAVRGENGGTEGLMTRMKRIQGTGDEASDICEAEEDAAILTLARDELPFLDSDVARALTLFTLEDFLFFCDEFHVPFSRSHNKQHKTSDISSNNPKRGNSDSSSSSNSWGRSHRYSSSNSKRRDSSDSSSDLNSSKSNSSSSSRESNDKEGDVTATCLNSLQAAGIRYVAVHLLEFGGDHLDRLLRFFQLTGKPDIYSIQGNLSSSSEDRPHTYRSTKECCSSSSSHIHTLSSSEKYSRSSSNIEIQGRAEKCSSTSNTSTWSKELPDSKACGSAKRSMGESRASENMSLITRASSSILTERHSTSTSSASSRSSIRETPACSCDLENAQQPFAHYIDELQHWRIIVGRGSVTENALAATAAEKILRDEQHRFEKTLVARARAAVTIQTNPGASSIPVRAPYRTCRFASPSASGNHVASVSNVPKAAPGTSAMWGEETGSSAAGRQDAFSTADRAARQLSNPNTSVRHDPIWKKTATAAYERASGAPLAAKGVSTTGGREACAREAREGKTSLSAIAAETSHKPVVSCEVCRQEGARTAEATGKCVAAEDKEECNRNTKEFLKVLRRSAQLLSDTAHTLYFLNCRSLIPTSLATPCNRACCCISGVRTPQLCFMIDPTAFSTCLGRLSTIAMVKWYSTFSHEDNNNGSRRAGSAPSQKRNQEVHSGNSNSSRCNSGHQSWNSRSGIAPETQSGERPKISFICCRLVVPPPLPTFASKPRSGSTDGRVIAEGGRTTGRTCEQELLERCCSCCTRENFKIALHVLQRFNTKEQEQQEGSILQRHRRHNFADDTLPFTDSEGILAGASRAAPVAATSVGPATKETPAGSRNTGTPKLSNSGELQAGEEAAELSDTSLKKNRACPKVSADESTHAEELEREKGCDNMTSRAEDEEARSGFRLFMHFLQEAAAAAVIAARSAKVHEEAELAIAAEEELALRCSPHFLFIHALLHFMWACHAAGDPGASAAAGLEGPEAALDQIHAAAREGNVEAVEAAQSTPLKERDIVKTGIETKASTVWAPDTTAQRMDAAPSGIPKCSRKALPGGMNATLPGGVVANKESICTSSGAAEKASEDAGEQVGCLCHDLTGRRNEMLSEGSHSTKQELHTLEANREKEALQQVSLRRMCDHGLSSQLHQICSRLQLSTIYPVQLLDAVNRVRQQQVLPPLTPQMPMEQQQLQSLSALEVASLEEQKQHQHQLDNRKNTQVWFPHQQVQQQCKEDVREAYQKQRLWHHPGTVDRQQQQERLVGIHQGEGEQLEGGEEERKKSLTLLQPPFSVGAVVNLFAELLRLTCVQRQNQHTSAGMVPFACGMREPAAGVEAGTFLDERAGLSPSVSLTPAAAWSRGQRMRGQQEQPATANSSPMTYGAAIADEVRGKVRKGKVSKKIAAARAPARRLKLPTGELGRQLLLMFLRLVKKRRRLVQLCLSSKKSSDEAQSAALSESLASRERGLDPSLFFVNVNINCWFSLLDAAVLLNDGEVDEDEDDVAFSATQKQENTPGSEIYNCMETGFAVVVPEARRKLLTGDSTSTCSMSCGGAVLLAAESGGRPVTGATTAHDATSQAAAEARRVCTFCEEYHERMEQVAAPAEEEAFVPHSTFLQLFPNLLEGLMDAGAALPYCDSAAPFPPVLLELRWVRQPPFPYNRIPAKEEQPSLPAHCAAPSVLSERPRKAGGALPRASEESRICSSFTGALPASRLTAPAGNLTLHAGVELGTREKQATEAAMETWQASENALSIPEECRLAREVDQCSPSACMWSPAARDPAAAEESHTPKTASSVTLKTFASPCSTTTARPRAGVEENSCMPECCSSGVMPTLGAVLLAPAGLLRRLRTDNDPARKSPGKRHAAGSDVFSKEIKKGAFSAKRAVEAKRDCKNGAFYVADDVDTDGAAFAEESTRKEGCAVRLALQEQLFNYIYYHFQKDVRAGPLPEDFWRHINWTRKHGSNGGPECFTSRGNRSGWRDSCNETKVDKHIQTQWLESVEECVLKSLNMQLLLLCESLRKFAACVTQQGRDDIPSRTHRTNLDVHPISNTPIMLQQRDNPAGSDFGAVCRPATQLLQQGHPQTNQPQEKQDAKIREQQHCEQQVTEQETDLREYAYNTSLKNHPVSHPLSAPGNTSLASSAAAVEVATAAHMLLQLAGDVALIARIKGSAFDDDISSARWGCCSGETIEVSVDAATEARANSAARPWNGDVSNKVMDPLALRTAATEAPEVVEASEGANTPIAAFRESIATVDGRPAAESESLHMTAAGGCEVLTGDALLSATGSSIIINRGQLSGERRHSTCIKDPKEERTGISGCGCGMLRWWVKDEKCSAGIIPVRKVVVEVTGGNGADGGRPHGESASNVHAFPPSRFSTSCAVCTHQVEVDSLAALDSVLRYASYFQQQQEYHDGTQNAQYRKTSQRICQLNDPKAHAERKQHTEAQKKNAVTAFHVQDYTKSTFSMDNVLCPVHEATTVTAKTEAACSWLNLLCQLEQRENISLTLL